MFFKGRWDYSPKIGAAYVLWIVAFLIDITMDKSQLDVIITLIVILLIANGLAISEYIRMSKLEPKE